MYSPIPPEYFCFFCGCVGHHWIMECNNKTICAPLKESEPEPNMLEQKLQVQRLETEIDILKQRNSIISEEIQVLMTAVKVNNARLKLQRDILRAKNNNSLILYKKKHQRTKKEFFPEISRFLFKLLNATKNTTKNNQTRNSISILSELTGITVEMTWKHSTSTKTQAIFKSADEILWRKDKIPKVLFIKSIQFNCRKASQIVWRRKQIEKKVEQNKRRNMLKMTLKTWIKQKQYNDAFVVSMPIKVKSDDICVWFYLLKSHVSQYFDANC